MWFYRTNHVAATVLAGSLAKMEGAGSRDDGPGTS